MMRGIFHRGQRSLRGEAGLTLVEMMVSILLMAIIFSAVAASIITFTRSAATSEHQVESTALLNRLHEEFSVIPWGLAGNLEAELVADAGRINELFGLEISFPSTASEPRFDDALGGERAIVIVDDSGTLDETACVEPLGTRRAPRALIEDCEFRERIFDVAQIVTDIDRSGDGEPDTKRLTTVANWQWLGRDFTQRLDSERSLSVLEVPGPGSTQLNLDVDPDVIYLAEDGTVDEADPRNPDSLTLTASFNNPDFGAETMDVTFPTVDSLGETVEGSVGVPGDITTYDAAIGGYSRFEGPLNLDGLVFAPGLATFRAESGSTAGTSVVANATVEFRQDSGDGGETDVPLRIASFSANPLSVNFNSNRFRCALEFEARVEGLTSDYTLNVTWEPPDGNRSVGMTLVPPAETVDPAGSDFQARLGTTADHGFESAPNNFNEPVTFTLRATTGADVPVEQSLNVTLRNNNGNC